MSGDTTTNETSGRLVVRRTVCHDMLGRLGGLLCSWGFGWQRGPMTSSLPSYHGYRFPLPQKGSLPFPKSWLIRLAMV